MNKDYFKEAMQCKFEMKSQALIWSMVKQISKLLNENMVSYDEFQEIFSIIDHYTHHEAEWVQHENEIRYKSDNKINMKEDLDYDEVDPEDLEWIIVDIDECDGEWFIIPEI